MLFTKCVLILTSFMLFKYLSKDTKFTKITVQYNPSFVMTNQYSAFFPYNILC